MTVISSPLPTRDIDRVRPFATLTVDHEAIMHNVCLVRAIAGVPVLAVVKADGFGLGMTAVARSALRGGAVALGVATVDEALRLRAAGISARILAWLADAQCDLDAAIRLGVELGCSTGPLLETIVARARTLGLTARVHLELDTGLSRGGADRADWAGLCRSAAAHEHFGALRVVGVWSHLARANEAHPLATAGAIETLTEAAVTAASAGLTPEVVHLASSGAALAHPGARFSLVRCGQALFGVQPVDGEQYDLRPVLRLTSRVVQLRRVPAGTAVSYGGGYRTEAETTLALVPIGYADGIPRLAGDRAEVLLRGRRCRVVGRVSMDQLVVDAGPVDSEVADGDEVVVIGDPARGEPGLGEWAQWAHTIPQEIMTGIGSRVERRHLGAARVA
ncbi:alanine racemase [Leifsonia poae]|uniref:alanine racemase n=1 Tax=Leifsonia poae TaxID=110933 RepID=UPI001CBF1831|nr:alanine racemase [Leifsonia poae]